MVRRGIAQTIRDQVDLAKNRRDEKHIHDVFNSFRPINGMISKDSFKLGLLRLGVSFETIKGGKEDFESLFLEIDRDEDGKIDLGEFTAAVKKPTAIERWAKNIHWWQCIADAVPATFNTTEPLRAVAELTDEQIEAICMEAHRLNVQKLIEESRKLKKAYKAMDAKQIKQDLNTAAGKFQVSGVKANTGLAEVSVFKANAGKAADFFKGLGGRVGAPNSKFKEGMKLEHCSKFGADVEFTTSNYKITTTPKTEWLITVERSETKNIAQGRKIQHLSILMTQAVVEQAQLIEEEVISIVLYTGPMVIVIAFGCSSRHCLVCAHR